MFVRRTNAKGHRTEEVSKVRWPSRPYGHLQVKNSSYDGWQNLDIIETDYTNFAVLYSCRVKDLGTNTQEVIHVLSRKVAEIGTSLHTDLKRVGLESLGIGFPSKDVVNRLSQISNY